MKGQRKLSRGEVLRLTEHLARIERQGIAESDAAFVEALTQEVQVDLPTGELLNPAIEPLVRAWMLQGRPIVHGEITARHQLDAQGLEGLVSMRMPLRMARLPTLKASPHRSEVLLLSSHKGIGALHLQAPEEPDEDEEDPDTPD